jgi:hypothetical protein
MLVICAEILFAPIAKLFPLEFNVSNHFLILSASSGTSITPIHKIVIKIAIVIMINTI